MKNQKLYFRSFHDEICYPFEYHLKDAKDEELETITLVEAIPDEDIEDFVWCSHYENIEEKSLCRKNNCSSYTSKSGRGVCQHRGKLYTHGNEVVFNLKNELKK